MNNIINIESNKCNLIGYSNDKDLLKDNQSFKNKDVKLNLEGYSNNLTLIQDVKKSNESFNASFLQNKKNLKRLKKSQKLNEVAKRQKKDNELTFISALEEDFLNSSLSDLLKEKNFSKVLTYIQSICLKTLKKTRESNQILVDQYLGKNRKIVIKPSGKVYFCLETLGKGAFKTTEKGLFLGKLTDSFELLEQQEPKFRAISIPLIGTKNDALEDEFKVNVYLRKKKKENHHLSNVNIAKTVSENKIMIAELYDGDLNKLIQSNNLNVTEIPFIAMEMARGLKQLHQVEIVHRDCKLDNFLFKLNDQNKIDKVYISDFGVSCPINEPDLEKNIFFPMSDPSYPEISYSEECDIYNLGMSYLLLYTGYTVEEWKSIVFTSMQNLPGADQLDFRTKTVQWKKQPLEDWIDLKGEKIFNKIQDDEVKEILIKMLAFERKMRPNLEEIISFFEGKI